MGEVSTIGLDIAKSVFQVHGVDVDGTVVIRKRVSRSKVLEFFSTKGRNGTAELFKIIADEKDGRIPAAARFSLDVLARQHAAIAPHDGRGVYRAKSRNVSETRARMRSRSRSRPLPPPAPGLHSSSRGDGVPDQAATRSGSQAAQYPPPSGRSEPESRAKHALPPQAHPASTDAW